ncbi:MAG: glycosyltransferase family 2 protein [Candidatus Bruticola sp.]
MEEAFWKEKCLSIIIPCYNEETLILDLVMSVLSSSVPNKEIIVVDDGSNDNTPKILREVVESLVSKVIYCSENRGKGAAVRRGLAEASGDVVIIQDADFEYSPEFYKAVVRPVFAGEVEACYGSRFAERRWIPGAYVSNILANWFLTNLSNFFTGYHLTDMETCFKAIRRDIFQSLTLEQDRFGIEPEITAKLAKKRCRIAEVPISYAPRCKSSGKKIGFRDGLQAISCIFKYR